MIKRVDNASYTIKAGETAVFRLVNSDGTAVPVKLWKVSAGPVQFVTGDDVKGVSAPAAGSTLASFTPDPASQAPGCRLKAGEDAGLGSQIQLSAYTEVGKDAKPINVYLYVVPTGAKAELGDPSDPKSAQPVFKATAKVGDQTLKAARIAYQVNGGAELVALDDKGKATDKTAKAGQDLIVDSQTSIRVSSTKKETVNLTARVEGSDENAVEKSVNLPDVPAKLELKPAELTLRAGESQPVEATVRDASGTALDVKVKWELKSDKDGELVSFTQDEETGALTVTGKKSSGNPATLVAKVGDEPLGELKVIVKAGIKRIELVGPNTILSDQDVTYSIRLRDDKGANVPLPADATVDIQSVDGANAYNDPKNPQQIIVRADQGGSVRIQLSVQLPNMKDPVSDTVRLTARSIQGFSPVSVNLDIVDDATAEDLFGAAISKNFFVVKARIFNNLDHTPDGKRTGQSILAYRDSIEVGIDLEKKYDDERKSAVPVAFRNWSPVEPSDFVREYSRPYENEPNSVANRSIQSDGVLVRRIGDRIQIGSTPPDAQFMTVGSEISPRVEVEGQPLPPGSYQLVVRSTESKWSNAPKVVTVVGPTLVADHEGVAVIDVVVDGKVVTTFSVVVQDASRDVSAGAEPAQTEIVRVGGRIILHLWRGSELVPDAKWEIVDGDKNILHLDEKTGIGVGSAPGTVLVRGTSGSNDKIKQTLLIRVVTADGAETKIRNGLILTGIVPGQALALKPEELPDYASVTWLSADNHVVKVIDGVLTAVGPGTTTVDYWDSILDVKNKTGNTPLTAKHYRFVVSVDPNSGKEYLPPSVFRYQDKLLQVKHLLRYRPYSDQMIVASFESREDRRPPTVLNRIGQVVNTIGAGLSLAPQSDLGKGFLVASLVQSAVQSAFPDKRDVRRQNLVNMLMPQLVEIPFGGEISTILLFPKREIGGMIRGHKVRISEIDTSYFNITVGIIDKRQTNQGDSGTTPSSPPPVRANSVPPTNPR